MTGRRRKIEGDREEFSPGLGGIPERRNSSKVLPKKLHCNKSLKIENRG